MKARLLGTCLKELLPPFGKANRNDDEQILEELLSLNLERSKQLNSSD
jgi:hypothetical protein